MRNVARYTLAVILLVLSASATQSQSKQAPLDDKWLAGWLADLEGLPPAADSKAPYPSAVRLLNNLEGKVGTTSDIRAFRAWAGDDEAVNVLLPYASGPFAETRLPAARVLVNVVDNTNVCQVIAYLLENPSMNANGRFNLLQVVQQVSSYANPDTELWIRNFVTLERASMSPDMDRTATLLDQIQATLSQRKLGEDENLIDWSGDSYDKCVARLAPINADVVLGEITDAAPLSLTVATLRDHFFSAERRKYVDFLVDTFGKLAATQQSQLASTVLQAIVLPDEDPQRRYRINLYIALTLSKLPALPSDIDFSPLRALTDSAEYRQDSTFRDNVDDALARQLPLV